MRLFSAFADVLDYPGDELPWRVEKCLAAIAEDRRLAATADAASDDVWSFKGFVAAATGAQLEELYTAAFDMEADCALYAGHHLFGEDGRRVLFMCHLAGLYRDASYRVADGEAPDHLVAILRYVDHIVDPGARAELLADAVAPAAARVGAALERREHPYAPLLRALAACAAAGAAAESARVSSLEPVVRESAAV